MALEVSVVTVVPLAVAILTLVVAVFVLFLDFGAPVYRAFALLLWLKAVVLALFFFVGEALDLGWRLRFYAWIALPFAALHFALTYRRQHNAKPAHLPSWFPAVLLASCALAFELAYLLDRSLFYTTRGLGPLAAFSYLDAPTLAAIALLFALEARAARRSGGQAAFLAAALGLSLQPLFYGTFRLADLAFDLARGQKLQATFLVTFETAALLAMAACAALVMALSLAVRRRRTGSVWLSVMLWAACVASGLAMAFLFRDGSVRWENRLLSSINAAWILGLPVLTTYALVRYRLFDAEVRIRFAIKGTTLAAVFVGTFFVVAKLTESWAERVFGQNWVVGAVAAGLMLFALSPLQNLAERLAHRAVPGGRPMTHLPHKDRVQIYREQLEVAWADGTLTQKERLLFAKLQERLALSAEEAMALEHEVVAGLAKSPVKRAGRKAAA